MHFKQQTINNWLIRSYIYCIAAALTLLKIDFKDLRNLNDL